MESYEDMMVRHGSDDYFDASDLEASDEQDAAPETGEAEQTAKEHKPASPDMIHICEVVRLGRIPMHTAGLIRAAMRRAAGEAREKLFDAPRGQSVQGDKSLRIECLEEICRFFLVEH